MPEFRHALIAASACFVLLIAAGMSAAGMGVFQAPVLALLAAISAIAAIADVIIRRKRGMSIK